LLGLIVSYSHPWNEEHWGNRKARWEGINNIVEIVFELFLEKE